MEQNINSGVKRGPCFGGPANSLTLAVTADLGFLWVDPTLNMLWIYNWQPTRKFICADSNGQLIAPDLDNGILYGVENESSYAALIRPSQPVE